MNQSDKTILSRLQSSRGGDGIQLLVFWLNISLQSASLWQSARHDAATWLKLQPRCLHQCNEALRVSAFVVQQLLLPRPGATNVFVIFAGFSDARSGCFQRRRDWTFLLSEWSASYLLLPWFGALCQSAWLSGDGIRLLVSSAVYKLKMASHLVDKA